MQISITRIYRYPVLVLLSLCYLLILGNNGVTHADEGFTNGSLKGNYAVINIGRGGQTPQAGVSVATYDGKGKFSGITIQDLPGPSLGERTFVRAAFEGIYKVNANGTGTGSIKTTLPNGTISEVNIVLMITESEIVNGIKVAKEFSFMHETLSSGTGGLLTLVATRLPAKGKFTNTSLKGDYSYTVIGRGGYTPQSGLGVITYDGKGSFSGTATVNIQGLSFGERLFITAPFVRPYSVNPDGTGMATPPGESEIVFVITRAEVDNDLKVAKEVFFIVRDLNPATGNLLTGFIKKL